jgi:DNA ligase-1
LVDTKLFNKPSKDIEDIVLEQHNICVLNGYEGVMVRNCDSLYKSGYRSKDLQKYKEFIDDEFEIVGGQEATGEDKGTVIFECMSKKCVFSVRPRGSREFRRQMWENLQTYIGKKLTVRYQNLSELGVPRFPVGISVRDYE